MNSQYLQNIAEKAHTIFNYLPSSLRENETIKELGRQLGVAHHLVGKRSFKVKSVGYNSRGPVTSVAWLNSEVGNISIRVSERDNTLVPLLNVYDGRSPLTNLQSDLKNVSPLSSSALLRAAINAQEHLHGNKSSLIMFSQEMAEFDKLIYPLYGARVLLVDDKGDLVGQIGMRNWVYPKALDLLDTDKMHLTKFVAGADGRQKLLPSVSIATYLGIEPQQEQEATPDQDEPCTEEEWFNN